MFISYHQSAGTTQPRAKPSSRQVRAGIPNSEKFNRPRLRSGYSHAEGSGIYDVGWLNEHIRFYPWARACDRQAEIVPILLTGEWIRFQHGQLYAKRPTYILKSELAEKNYRRLIPCARTLRVSCLDVDLKLSADTRFRIDFRASRQVTKNFPRVGEHSLMAGWTM